MVDGESMSRDGGFGGMSVVESVVGLAVGVVFVFVFVLRETETEIKGWTSANVVGTAGWEREKRHRLMKKV